MDAFCNSFAGCASPVSGPRLLQRAGRGILQVQNRTYKEWLPRRVYGQNLTSDRPRVNEDLLRMMRTQHRVGAARMEYINTHKVNSLVHHEWLHKPLGVYDGQDYVLIFITQDMIGKKLKDIVPQRDPFVAPGPKNLRKKYAMMPRVGFMAPQGRSQKPIAEVD